MKPIKLFFVLCSLCLSTSFLYSQDFLKASGKNIVNGKGENVLLRGIGLGGWMLQEGYMLKLQGNNPQFTIRKKISALLSPEQTQQFYDVWLNNHTTKADIDSLHAWGFNSVRLPMHYNLYTLPLEAEPDSTTQTWLIKGFDLTDSLLRWCKANQMYLILDLHAAPGGQGNDVNIADRDTSKPALWQSEGNRKKTIALWVKLAEKYKDEPAIGGYDLLNETNWGFNDLKNDPNGLKEPGNAPLRQLLMDITTAIRAVDKNHLVIIEGNGWGNNYRGVLPLWDGNMAVSFHKYWNNNDLGSIKGMLETRDKYNVPIWVGETGENSNVWFTQAIQLFESNNIGWAWWPLKKVGFNNPLEVRSNHNYDRLVKYWNGQEKNPPKESDVYSGLLELATYTNIRSNRVHRDVIDAMLRQPFSNETMPFKSNIISQKDSIINAVDYDLGKNKLAYNDNDTGNYYISTGSRSAGNKGGVYRNDGVDIYKDSSHYEHYYVGDTEAGEWLQYSINVTAGGTYQLKVVTSADSSASVSLYIDNQLAKDKVILKATGGTKKWATQLLSTDNFSTGNHRIRILIKKGGFNFKQLIFTKK